MYRSLSPKQFSPYYATESDRRDVLIKEITKEIHSLQSLDHDFLALNDSLADLESRYARLLEEKEREEREFKLDGQSKRLQSVDLRQEAEALALKLEKTLVNTEEVCRENECIVDHRQALQTHIKVLQQEISQTGIRNQTSHEKLIKLEEQLRQLKGDRARLENTCDCYSSELTALTEEVKSLEKQSRTIDASLASHQLRLSEEQRIKTRREAELKKQRSDLSRAERDNADLTLLQEEQNRIRCGLTLEVKALKEERAATKEQQDKVAGINKETLAKLKLVESDSLKASLEIENERNTQAKLHARNASTATLNCELNVEIDRLMREITERERRKQCLSQHLKDSLVRDSKVQSILACRKEPLQTLLGECENVRPADLSMMR